MQRLSITQRQAVGHQSTCQHSEDALAPVIYFFFDESNRPLTQFDGAREVAAGEKQKAFTGTLLLIA